MSGKQTFESVLEKHGEMDATKIAIPFDVEQVFGAKRLPVKISINAAAYRTTVFRMGGKFILVIPKVFRQAANIRAGEKVIVTMEKDSEKRTVEIPEALAEVLKKEGLTEIFAKMSYTHQKEYVNAVKDAKKEETRMRRIAKTVEILREKIRR